jgi:hypothetical protein
MDSLNFCDVALPVGVGRKNASTFTRYETARRNTKAPNIIFFLISCEKKSCRENNDYWLSLQEKNAFGENNFLKTPLVKIR